MSKILYNSLICILWKKNMSDNPKDTSENPRNIPENSKNIIDELKEFYKKISPIVKLTSLVVSAFSIIISFTFAMVYMRDNGFFSYEIFSINFIWIFLLIGILFVIIHGFYIFGAYLCVTQNSKKRGAFLYYWKCSAYILYILGVLL